MDYTLKAEVEGGGIPDKARRSKKKKRGREGEEME